MLRLLALCLAAALLSSCEHREAAQRLPDGCRMATAADLRQIQIYSDDPFVGEAVEPKRAAVTGEPTFGDEDEARYDWSRPHFRLSQDDGNKKRECLAFGWKVVPVGPVPASAEDFQGGRLPRGIAIVPKDGPGAEETLLPIRAVDDRKTEQNERFRIELFDKSGRTIWGAAEQNRDAFGSLVQINPNAAVYTIHDTERDCARPGAGSGNNLSVKAWRNLYWLVIEQPSALQQCTYVAWRFIDSTVPDLDPHPDAQVFLQGMAYFTSNEDNFQFGGAQQWFNLDIPVTKENAGRQVRIAWALGSDHPAIATLKLPERLPSTH